jgi:hypothetical protein
MIDIKGVVGGIFYFYNSQAGSINMNTIKKMKAIQKLLGGCNSLVEITAESLLIKIGLQTRLEDLNEKLRLKELSNTNLTTTTNQIIKQIDISVKDISNRQYREREAEREEQLDKEEARANAPKQQTSAEMQEHTKKIMDVLVNTKLTE